MREIRSNIAADNYDVPQHVSRVYVDRLLVPMIPAPAKADAAVDGAAAVAA